MTPLPVTTSPESSNVQAGGNPSFTFGDFLLLYPQFALEEIPPEVAQLYLALAHSCVGASRYRSAWKTCIGLFLAHFLTLYLQSLVQPDSGAAAVVQAGQTKGLAVAKSIDGVSISYDFATALQDLNGWAGWKLTTYGVQFATFAKMFSKGGLLIP